MLRLLTCILSALRFLLAVAAAAALLYTFSYPDSLLPPNPAIEDIEGITPISALYAAKPLLWLLPLMVLELICLTAPQRNRLWFASLLTVFIGALLAWPPLLAWRPELVHPMLQFEDGKLVAGLGYMAIFLCSSALFRLVLLAHFFERPDEWQGDSDIDVDVLDPENARTVREIAADTRRVQPHFLFGEADQGIIERFRHLMGRLWKQRLRNRLLLGTALLTGLLWFFLYPRPDEQQAAARDLAAMYETDASGLRATPRAVHAAYRIMRAIHDGESFAGLTLEEAEKRLHADTVPEAYRRRIRDEKAPSPASVEPVFESRTPFLTITDGHRTAALYIRTDQAGEHINTAEVVDAGWNAVADEQRRILGADWRINY